MKKLLLGITLLSSVSVFASTTFVEGIYTNGNAECELELSYDDDNVRVLTANTSITPYGVWPFLSETVINKQYEKNDGVVSFDTSTGMSGFKVVTVNVTFDGNKQVSAFSISDNTGNTPIICKDVSLRKEVLSKLATSTYSSWDGDYVLDDGDKKCDQYLDITYINNQNSHSFSIFTSQQTHHAGLLIADFPGDEIEVSLNNHEAITYNDGITGKNSNYFIHEFGLAKINMDVNLEEGDEEFSVELTKNEDGSILFKTDNKKWFNHKVQDLECSYIKR